MIFLFLLNINCHGIYRIKHPYKELYISSDDYNLRFKKYSQSLSFEFLPTKKRNSNHIKSVEQNKFWEVYEKNKIKLVNLIDDDSQNNFEIIHISNDEIAIRHELGCLTYKRNKKKLFLSACKPKKDFINQHFIIISSENDKTKCYSFFVDKSESENCLTQLEYLDNKDKLLLFNNLKYHGNLLDFIQSLPNNLI